MVFERSAERGFSRDRVKARTGKCEGRKSIKEEVPDVLKVIKRLRRQKPGQKRDLCGYS